ncbi:MAG: PrsW family intramembrane metalloprotease [Actinomycetaceae bacterium]|nr:PrsW family intramembrane metalloprotease [Actinomycetaceae bacterium]MDU0969446.1 PrsW family intramembrane metalloprotease [Actinomycetaceae bacterium]
MTTTTTPSWDAGSERFRLSTRRMVDPLIPTPDLVQTAAYHPSLSTKGHGKRPWLEIILGTLSVIGLIAIVTYLWSHSGTIATVVSALAAGLPLLFVTATFIWIDRWEPEPKWLLALAFLWGAGMATSLALISNQSGQALLGLVTTTASDANALTGAIVAPFVEESLKGLGVLILLVARRRHVTSPLDGVVVAGLVGAGFAFTENILYFMNAGNMLVLTFVMRAIASPFCHSMFTSMTGLATAMAITRLRGRHAWWWAAPIGWVTAVLLHSLWNGFATFTGGGFLLVYLVFWVPFFLGWIIIIAVTAAKQRRWIVAGLQGFVEAGWIHPGEVAMIQSLPWRRSARKHARRISRRAKRAMTSFQNAASRLGLTYVASVRLGPSPMRQSQTAADLDELVEARACYAREVAAHR